MGDKKIIFLFGIFFSLIFGLSFISAWWLNGTTYDNNGIALNGTIINITIRDQGFNVVGYNWTFSNATGGFNLNVSNSDSWMYEPSLQHFQGNVTDGSQPINYIGQSLPAFPYQELQSGMNVNFYLTNAGTINITAVNATGSAKTFQYQIKDQILGYPISQSWSMVSQATIYVPRNRNYSIMIYPNQSLPVSFNWNNFSATSDYSFTYNSNYNATTKILSKQFNATETLVRVSGTIFNETGQALEWTEFTVIPFVLEPGNMIYIGDENAGMPYNMSVWGGGSDIYNLSAGTYNITLPAPAENVTYLLFASARNGTTYYGGYRNITLSYGDSPTQINFTMQKLMGTNWGATNNNMSMKDASNWQTINISSAKQTFNIVNSSNSTLSSLSAHIEITLDYSNYNATEFTFMTDIAQGSSSSFYLPLINATGVKEMNIYSMNFAPKIVSTRTPAQILANNNITLTAFNPGDVDGEDLSDSVYVSFYRSNSTCDVPTPPTSCSLASSASMDEFNPLGAIIGGGALSFRMGLSSSGIEVHYVNVDMLASGPPDALFDDSATTSTSSGFDSAMRFGSGGPTIYDYILISMPYTEGSSSNTGLNESAQVNMSIPILYDENWNILWNTTANGTNGTLLSGNQSHYNTYSSQWQTLMGNNTCVTNVSTFNSTNPCYINTTSNRIWIRLPHFSGTQPNIAGSAITASSSSSSSSTSSSSSSGGGASSFWINTFIEDDKELSEKSEINKQLTIKSRVKLKIENETIYIGVIQVKNDSVLINVSANSKDQQASIFIGEINKFDINDDGIYDVSVALNSINSAKADLTMKYIQEAIPAETEDEQNKESNVNSKDESLGEKLSNLTWLWILIAVVIVGVIVGIVVSKGKK